MDAARKLKKVKIALMRNPKFALWSGILMVGKTTVDDAVQTAATNGRDMVFGRDFIDSLNEKELAFVILHEALHIAFRHLTTWRALWEKDPRLANMACDYVINLILYNMDPAGEWLEVPKRDGKQIALLDHRFAKMNTKQVFKILEQEQEEQEQDGNGGAGSGGGECLDEHDWEGAEEMTEVEQEELGREIERALRQGQMLDKKMNGPGSGNTPREIEDLLKPQVDWREQLREFVNAICANRDTSSWRKVNRRFLHMDTYMPTLVGESVGHIVVGVDTSGSIGQAEITRFLSEIQGIAEAVSPEQVDLMYWDCSVAGHEVYDVHSLQALVGSTKPLGGGGTDPRCVARKLKEDHITPECIIMLTDGHIMDWGDEWEAPTLWAIIDNKGTTAPVGSTVHVDS